MWCLEIPLAGQWAYTTFFHLIPAPPRHIPRPSKSSNDDATFLPCSWCAGTLSRKTIVKSDCLKWSKAATSSRKVTLLCHVIEYNFILMNSKTKSNQLFVTSNYYYVLLWCWSPFYRLGVIRLTGQKILQYSIYTAGKKFHFGTAD